MSKKRRWRPVSWSRSKNFSRSAGSRPVAVRVVGRHVVGHDVEHDPQPGLADRPRPARRTPPRRRARSRSSSGRRRRSRGSSPRAPGTTAAGTGARSRDRAGRARARAPPRSRSPPPSWSRYVARSSVMPRRGAAAPASGAPARSRRRAAISSLLRGVPRCRARPSTRSPNALVRERERESSWWALKRSRNESSSTWRPRESGRGDLLAVEEHADDRRQRRPSPRSVMRSPSARNHAASGSPEPSISSPEQELRGGGRRRARAAARSACA